MSQIPRKRTIPASIAAKAAGLAGIAALVAGSLAHAQDEAPAIGERVALALAAAQTAQSSSDRAGLARALGVIERSGARPLDDWKGPDPVPTWRAQIADGVAPMRGSPLGPGYRTGQVRAGRSDSFEQVFLSGRKTTIALSTPGNSPLTLQVLDADRRTVCSTGDARRACRWIPVFTQRYVIEVHNAGNQLADYFLVVE